MKRQYITMSVLSGFAAACFIFVFVVDLTSDTASQWDLILRGIPALILPGLSVHYARKARHAALTNQEK